MSGHLARMQAQQMRSARIMAGTPSQWDDAWYGSIGLGASDAGISVTPDLAMTISAFWAGTNFLARNLATTSCHIYRRLDKGKQKVPTYPTYRLVRNRPNAWQTNVEYWEMNVGHLISRGNAYSEIVPGPRGFAEQLIPRHPDRVYPSRLPSGRLQYRVLQGNVNGTDKYLTQDEMFHIRGFSSDGVSGLSMIAYGSQSLGTALAQERFAGQYYGQGIQSALAVISKEELGEDGLKNLHQSVTQFAAGPKNAHGVLTLEGDLAIQDIGLKAADVQILSAREHTVREVARWLGLPTHVLADAGKPPTYASIEMFGIELVVYAFRPLAARIEAAINRDLILEDDQDEFFAAFNMESFLRGDSASRARFYASGIQWGYLSRNEVREMENRNGDDPALDKFLEPENMRQAGSKGKAAPAAAARAAQVRQQLYATRRGLLLTYESARRVVRKELAVVGKLATQHANNGEGWQAAISEFYTDHVGFVAQTLQLPTAAARAYCERQRQQLGTVGLSATVDWEWVSSAELANMALDVPGEVAA